ncbi:alpha/beta hydrolase-fold protein [Breoghania sp. JC706]|uniref:alpha/beta hydrolase n=1 Tax=Breoghania sp. JC706 TaxID=3117732 RepID=UPI003009DFB9
MEAAAESLPQTKPVTVEGAETFDVTASATGAPYRVFLSTPTAPAPEGGYPIIYLLDANADFAMLCESMRRVNQRVRYTNIDPAVIVGIGYPGTADFEVNRRMLDFTSGPSTDPDVRAEVPVGGADAFAAFIEDDLKPLIARMRAINPARQILFGHSLGGGFALELLAGRPELFHGWIAVSPSLWWNRETLLEKYAARKAAPAARLPEAGLRVMLLAGRLEEDIAPWHLAHPDREIFRTRKLRRRMCHNPSEVVPVIADTYPQAEVSLTLLEGEDHATVLAPAISKAFRFVLRPVVAG